MFTGEKLRRRDDGLLIRRREGLVSVSLIVGGIRRRFAWQDHFELVVVRWSVWELARTLLEGEVDLILIIIWRDCAAGPRRLSGIGIRQ